MDGRSDRGLVRELESNKASLNMKFFFDLELEVQELAGESRADDAANVGLNGPLRGFGAGCSLAVAPPGIGRQSLQAMKARVTCNLSEHLLYSCPFHYSRHPNTDCWTNAVESVSVCMWPLKASLMRRSGRTCWWWSCPQS